MSTPTSPVVFEIWSADDGRQVSRAGRAPAVRRDGRRPPSPVAMVLAALAGAAIASGGFLGAGAVGPLHDAHHASLLRQQVGAALGDALRAQGLVLVRASQGAPARPGDERGPCAPVRVERLGHC